MNHLKIFYISTETALKSHSNIKKKHFINIISSACLLEFLETLHATQLYRIPLIDLAWVFHWFYARVFVLSLAIKRESSLILQNICTKYYGELYDTDSGKCIPQKFVKDHKFSGLEIYLAKLECADIGYIEAMNERSTSSIKMKKNLFTLKEMCEKIKKSIDFPKISKSQISKTYLPKLTSSLRDFNNAYSEDGLEKSFDM